RIHPMGQHRSAARTLPPAARRLAVCLLGLLAGCHTPAAPFTADPGCPVPPRSVVLAEQFVDDTARDLVCRPLGFGRDLVCETAQRLAAAGQGLACKRLALCLHGPPPPLPPCLAEPDPDGLEAELLHVTGKDLLPAQVHLYPDGAGSLAAL